MSQVLFARIAQLVEHNLAKVGVASSNLVSRSSKASHFGGLFSLWGKGFRGSETWEVWLVKQRLTSLSVFDAANGEAILSICRSSVNSRSVISQVSEISLINPLYCGAPEVTISASIPKES